MEVEVNNVLSKPHKQHSRVLDRIWEGDVQVLVEAELAVELQSHDALVGLGGFLGCELVEDVRGGHSGGGTVLAQAEARGPLAVVEPPCVRSDEERDPPHTRCRAHQNKRKTYKKDKTDHGI